MNILEEETVPSLNKQIQRDGKYLTWKEYAKYIYNNKNMDFSKEQSLILGMNARTDMDLTDLAEKSTYSYEKLKEEDNSIDFEKQILSKTAELEIYKTIIPALCMRHVGSIEYRFGADYNVFISIDKNEQVCVWKKTSSVVEVDDDISTYDTVRKIDEYRTYNNISIFMDKSDISPENALNKENITQNGPLYNTNIS